MRIGYVEQNNETISCKQYSSKFIDYHILKYYTRHENSITCQLCNFIIKSNKRLQNQKQLSHDQNPHDIEKSLKCS